MAVKSVDGEAVVALSAGRHPKPYPHLDPNEDAVLAAVGRRRLLAAADGHNGFDAAAGAIRGLSQVLERLDVVADEPKAALAAFEDAAALGVSEALRRVDGERRRSRTALSPLLIGPRAVQVCQWGDTAAVRIRGDKARLLARPGRSSPTTASRRGWRPRGCARATSYSPRATG